MNAINWNLPIRKPIEPEFEVTPGLNIEATKSYYAQMANGDLCNCDYCQNYIDKIKAAYPKVSAYLSSLGIDIENPFETMPLEPDETGNLVYISAQYIMFGTADDFVKTVINSVNVAITDVHPSTQIDEAHFVIEISPIRLKWTV